MRVGINTGEVVLRSIRKDDLACRLCAGRPFDQPGGAHGTAGHSRLDLVTAYTHRLTDGYFDFKDLGPTQIKGVEEPLNIYEVLGAGPLRTRLQVSARRGLTRFVGRQSEMEQLQRALGASQSRTRADRRGDGRAGVRQVAVVLRVQAALA